MNESIKTDQLCVLLHIVVNNMLLIKGKLMQSILQRPVHTKVPLWVSCSFLRVIKCHSDLVQATELEVNMNAVERMVEYTSQPTEGSTQALTQDPPQGWPHAGAITIDNLQVGCLIWSWFGP